MLGAAAPVAASTPASATASSVGIDRLGSVCCWLLTRPWLSLFLYVWTSNISVLLRTSGRDAVTQDPAVCRVAQTTDHHLTCCLRFDNVAKANYNLVLE